MNKRLLKITGWLVGVLMLLTAGTFVVSYRTIKQSLGRVSYSPSIQNIIHENRERFKQEFKAQEISFVASDGIALQGYLVVRKGAEQNILICHGYRSAKEMMIGFADMFQHSNLLFFDFRAHGQSEGNLVTLGYNEKKDALAAIQFLQTNEITKALPVYGVGVSMGGVVLLSAAAEQPVFKGLVIDSAFARLEDQLAHAFYQVTGLPRYPFLSVSRLLFEFLASVRVRDVSPISSVHTVSTPILFIHSENDDEVPTHSSLVLYEAAQGKKEVWTHGPCRHATICFEFKDEYTDRVKKFFGTAL